MVGAEATEVALDHGETCVRDTHGTVRCWTATEHGEVVALQAEGDSPLVQLLVRWGFRCGLRHNGDLSCWKIGFDWTRGPFSLAGYDIKQASIVMDWGICGLLGDGSLRCWNQQGETELVYPGNDLVAITAYGTLCGLRANGTVRCWGRMEFDSALGLLSSAR